jgi:NAD(P)-dependent dehydrogenase (short-subunit alcohol dehydrogenase family)
MTGRAEGKVAFVSGLDVTVANAGIGNGGARLDKLGEGLWRDMITSTSPVCGTP